MNVKPNDNDNWLIYPTSEGEWWRKDGNKIVSCKVKFVVSDGCSHHDSSFFANYYLKNKTEEYPIYKRQEPRVFWQKIKKMKK